jgi:ATP-binding cassette, subfamily B, bacterial PglK
MIETVRRTFHLMARERRSRWWLLVALATFASVLEMVGAVLVYVLLGLVADPSGEIDLPLLGDIRGLFQGVDESSLLLAVAGLMAAFFIFRAAAQVFVTYVQNRVAHNAGARLANRLAVGYLYLPYAFHLQRNSSDIVRNANQSILGLISQAVLPMIHVAADSILALGLLTVMLVVSPLATALAVTVVGGAAVLLLFFVQPRLKLQGRAYHAAHGATMRALYQPLNGVRDIKVLGREAYFGEVYRRSRDRLARTMYLRGTLTDMPRHVIELALIGFMLAFFALAVVTGAAQEEVLSTLGLFAYAGLRLQPSLFRIVKGLNELKFANAPIEDIHADLLLVEEATRAVDAGEVLPFDSELRLEGVSFSYEGTDEIAISDVNLCIPAGEVVGICGPTGGGKTTLVDLMTGLLVPTGGLITVDGVDLAGHERAWQRNLGVVPQMVFLTDDTLRRNIAFGVPDHEIDDRALTTAVDLAQLRSFVDKLPDGLDSEVGERGVRISGGQRQRIAIARALYRGAKVLVLDEGTSALDNATEQQFMQALDALRQDRTILMVAHRLSTVRDCDQIIYVEDGRVAGVGTYESLSRDNAGFRSLAGGP